MYKPKLDKDIRCPLEYALDVFGGKWKSRIICTLALNTTMRYSELRRELGNITDTMLANSLKELQDDGMIIRTQYNEIPPKVEYSLTEKGNSVIPILLKVSEWGYKNRDEEKAGSCKNCPSHYYYS
ncbi:MAG: helix-turn-helix transcriptional regulator [Clostridiales bacterium]|jgi:DNA-binding HxlR family transcriptional regulator|nr:helix-turn-helix transcriptional regulator [Clostridiales bacterium]